MDSLFGLVGKDFVILAADTTQAQSIISMKDDEDKILLLDSHKLLATSGDPGSRVAFSEFVQKNVLLYSFRNSINLSTLAAANFTRGELAKALRTSSPYQVNMLLGGYEEDAGPSLFYLDYLATLHKLNFTAMGYCAYFILSLMDRHYKADMSVEEALALVDMCIVEVQKRLIVAPPNFVVKIADKDGSRVLTWRKASKELQKSQVSGRGAQRVANADASIELQA